jgi:ribosomal 50S subunit-associated protein YjgA (DUF615 family)
MTDVTREELRELRAEFRADLRDEIRPILERLDRLNGRTQRNELAIAVLQTRVTILAAGVGAVASALVSWVARWIP